MSTPPEVTVHQGSVAPEVAEELPGLALHWARLRGRDGASPPDLQGRLRQLSNGYRGQAVIAMRTKPVPAAYRNFFRQIGLDPDVSRPPGEQAALDRLFHGAFRSVGRLADALLVALVETGVPIWALDARHTDPEQLGIRTARAGDGVAPGTLVVADGAWIHAVLFGPPSAETGVSSETREMVLFAVSVEGVPLIHVEEALWLAGEGLRGSV